MYLFITLVRTDKWLMYFFKMNDGVVIFCAKLVWTILMIVNVRQKQYRCYWIHYKMKNKRKSKKKVQNWISGHSKKIMIFWLLDSCRTGVYNGMYFMTLSVSTLCIWFYILSSMFMTVHIRQKRCESLKKIFFVSIRCTSIQPFPQSDFMHKW